MLEQSRFSNSQDSRRTTVIDHSRALVLTYHMDATTLIAFAAVTFLAVVTPGPDVVLAMANGSRVGMRKAYAGMVGVLVSDMFLIIAVAAGLGALLAASEFWFSILKYAGAFYLAWLGYRMIRSGQGFAANQTNVQPPAETSATSVFLQCMIVAITNPKAYLFFSALFPQFIDPAQPQLLQFIALTIVFSVVEFAILFGYALVGSRASRFVFSASSRWLEKLCGGALLASAVTLTFVKRAN